jgi:hypothetical protein
MELRRALTKYINDVSIMSLPKNEYAMSGKDPVSLHNP